MKKIISAFDNIEFDTYLWCDSMVALAWIQGNLKRYKTFIANRCVQINKIVTKKNWRYIKSDQNPADCATRGIMPSKLSNHELWWTGPKWLQESEEKYPLENERNEQEIVIIKNLALTEIKDDKKEFTLPSVSSYIKLQKIIARCLRIASKNNNTKQNAYDHVTVNELRKAEKCIIKIIQSNHFGTEIQLIKDEKQIHKRSTLKSLSPFIDNDGILRVSGRLKHATIAYNAKHQMILPSKNKITELIIEETHKNALHGGSKLTEAMIRQKFWIPQGYKRINYVINKCVKCSRHNPMLMQNIMGNLPLNRITQNRPFLNVRTTKGRGYKSYKNLFVWPPRLYILK